MNNRTCRYSECSLALRTDIVYSRNSVHLNDTLLRLIERAIRVVPVGRTRERKARARDQREEEKKGIWMNSIVAKYEIKQGRFTRCQ